MAAHARLPTVGDTFGRYRIDRQIGRGGMGVVFGATDTTIARTVALKVVAANLGESEEFRLRFEREAAVLARLASPHVIDIYDYGTQDGCPYIATQYVGGGDLGALLAARGPMPPALALRVCAQVADALDDAHRVGVVHRDVKPTNVLLRDPEAPAGELYAYLCDFGIARTATDGLTAPGSVAGTWSYLAPECGRGGDASPASDIYALGCLLWATLTGRPPYSGTDVEIAVSHQRGPLPRLEGDDELSTRINLILERTMAKRPQDRYADADQLRLALTDASELSDSGIRPAPMERPDLAAALAAATPSGGSHPVSFGSLPPLLAPPAAPPSKRRGRVAVALVAVAVLAVIGGVVALTTLGGGNGSGDPSTIGTSDPATDSTDATTSGTPAPDPTSAGPGPRLDQGGPITGDTDGDGFGDLVVSYDRYRSGNDTRTSGTFVDTTTWTSNGSSFVPGDTVTADPAPGESDDVLTADFDGDDQVETITLTGPEDGAAGTDVRVTGELSGGGALDATVTAPATPVAYAAVDLDGDGSDDLVLETEKDAATGVFTGVLVKDGILGDPERLLETEAPQGDVLLEAGDFDGDTHGDLAVLVRRDTDAGYAFDVTTWLGDGRGGMAEGPSTSLDDFYTPQMLAADVDGDEDDELVIIGDAGSTTIDVLDVRQGDLVGPTRLGQFRGSSKQVASGVSDVDGDGLDDIVLVSVRSKDTARVLVARARPDGPFEVSSWAEWDKEFTKYGFFYDLTIEGGNF